MAGSPLHLSTKRICQCAKSHFSPFTQPFPDAKNLQGTLSFYFCRSCISWRMPWRSRLRLRSCASFSCCLRFCLRLCLSNWGLPSPVVWMCLQRSPNLQLPFLAHARHISVATRAVVALSNGKAGVVDRGRRVDFRAAAFGAPAFRSADWAAAASAAFPGLRSSSRALSDCLRKISRLAAS